MFPAAAVLRTVAVLTGLFAAWGLWVLFWSIVGMFWPSDWSLGRRLAGLVFWALWALGWALLTRRLWRKAAIAA